jgi:ferredoxin--NADP+ reductase
VGGKMQFACVDGPEFEGHDVDWDELNLRLRSYMMEEKASYDTFKECHGGGKCSCCS